MHKGREREENLEDPRSDKAEEPFFIGDMLNRGWLSSEPVLAEAVA
jgi:hypothetical protein